MKTETGFRIGPGMASLLMILVTLLMAALAILAMASAQNDSSLSERNVETTQSYYAAAAEMQGVLAVIDQRLIDARTGAAGDIEAYAQSVLAMQSEYRAQAEALALDEESAEEDGLEDGLEDEHKEEFEGEAAGDVLELRIAVPMGQDHLLIAKLNVARALAGPRYTMVSHTVVDNAAWESGQTMDLYPSF